MQQNPLDSYTKYSYRIFARTNPYHFTNTLIALVSHMYNIICSRHKRKVRMIEVRLFPRARYKRASLFDAEFHISYTNFFFC